MKVADSGVQVKECLCLLDVLEAFLASFLISGWSMRLLNQIVAPRRGNHLTVLCTVKLRQFTDGRAVAPSLFVWIVAGVSCLLSNVVKKWSAPRKSDESD